MFVTMVSLKMNMTFCLIAQGTAPFVLGLMLSFGDLPP